MPDTSAHTLGNSHYATTADGRKLHYMENGSGPVTVVFESGMGMSRSAWGLVQPLVAAHTRAVVYDRAGSGRSTPDPASRTLARMADDLECLLSRLGDGPFILVGHSWGGPVIRTAAARRPSILRGLVLIDPTDEHCGEYFTEDSVKHFAKMNTLLPLLAGSGLYRLIGARPGRVLPADVYREQRREDFTRRAAKTMVAEGAAFLEDLRGLRNDPNQLDGIDIAVISGTLITRMEQKFRPALHEAHCKSAASFARGRLIEARKSGHMIMYTEPQLIADEIVRMLPAAH
ncbi:alpha/beta hydrolase [Paenibacillus sp. MMS20-IR301]|uniref:alpha/beta fold hydrolase n=1 Tax=Paenibacillus sp. MMS20-IR301 TaxID=2895946 RepID=UPI0028E7EDCD|nr:alpha/beta hydrolase [Paenibacillus sp. MMS20-IR301]WNS45590.1 alpha/beta hydrolase [Paenibacillus sp. MMS20-IR301]